MKKFIVLIGNYGSGKTEIAINLAVNSAAKGLNTLVVDLDKVNDYFRMSDRVELLKENHVNLVSPTFAGQGVTPSNMSAAVAFTANDTAFLHHLEAHIYFTDLGTGESDTELFSDVRRHAGRRKIHADRAFLL